jgi:hypothetical protein
MLTLVLAQTCPVLADEVWHVTSGTNGQEHSTWTIEHLGTSANGHADVEGPDGTKTALNVMATPDVLRVFGMHPGSQFCQFEIHNLSGDKADGIEICIGQPAVTPWQATMDEGN